MEKGDLPRIIAADIFQGDLLIAFDDKRTALFPAVFLYEALPQVREVFDSGPEEDGDLASPEGDEDGW